MSTLSRTPYSHTFLGTNRFHSKFTSIYAHSAYSHCHTVRETDFIAVISKFPLISKKPITCFMQSDRINVITSTITNCQLIVESKYKREAFISPTIISPTHHFTDKYSPTLLRICPFLVFIVGEMIVGEMQRTHINMYCTLKCNTVLTVFNR